MQVVTLHGVVRQCHPESLTCFGEGAVNASEELATTHARHVGPHTQGDVERVIARMFWSSAVRDRLSRPPWPAGARALSAPIAWLFPLHSLAPFQLS
jgi:hypothetical protein